jgi:hypothetical protein
VKPATGCIGPVVITDEVKGVVEVADADRAITMNQTRMSEDKRHQGASYTRKFLSGGVDFPHVLLEEQGKRAANVRWRPVICRILGNVR